jgi:hypothetical protein
MHLLEQARLPLDRRRRRGFLAPALLLILVPEQAYRTGASAGEQFPQIRKD